MPDELDEAEQLVNEHGGLANDVLGKILHRIVVGLRRARNLLADHEQRLRALEAKQPTE